MIILLQKITDQYASERIWEIAQHFTKL